MANADSVESIRDQITQLAREIEQSSRTDAPIDTFFAELLRRLVTALGAPAGAVWLMDAQRHLRMITEIGLADIGYLDDPQSDVHNRQLLGNAIGEGQTVLISPDNASVPLPTEHMLVMGAVEHSGRCVGIVEIFQRPGTSEQARAGFLQFVEQMCAHAGRFLDRKTTQKTSPTEAQGEQANQFVLQLLRSLDEKEVAATAVNDGRMLVGSDRLSIAVTYGSRVQVIAISGQETVNLRANLVQRMSDLAKSVVKMAEPVSSDQTFEQLPPQIVDPLTEFMHESGSRFVAVLPLFPPAALVQPDDTSNDRSRRQAALNPFGCLIVEQISESEPRPGVMERAESVAAYAAAAISNARTHQQIFLLSLWMTIGKFFTWLRGRRMWKVVLTTAVVVGIVAGLVLTPWDYRVEGAGQLMPAIQQDIFAPWDGDVIEVLVTDGQRVKAGDVLIRLQNDDLRAEILSLSNQIHEKTQLLHALQAELDSAIQSAAREEEIRLQGRLVETRIEIEGQQQQLGVLKKREDQLAVRTPITGVVATFQVEQMLQNRPVQRGERLLEVMDDQGDWRLELDIQEHRLGHLLRGLKYYDDELPPVEFVLATQPEESYEGRFESLATRANRSEELGNVIQVYVDIDPDKLPFRSIGAEVQAKINCGPSNLGYVLFGDVIEFIQRQLWL